MFQANISATPAESAPQADLAALGFHFTADGTLLNTNTGKIFDFYQTSDERTNYIRKEAVQQAVRAHVLEVLREKYNIHEYYLTSDNQVLEDKPDSAHIPILMTEVSELVDRRDVIVHVGDNGQEMGIWAWRMMRDNGFLSKGTAIGLAEEAAGWGATLSNFGEVVHKPYAGFDIETEEVEGDPTPGLIFLNSGEFLYSPTLHKAMTLNAWTHRPYANPEGLDYPIDPISNSVPGHTDVSEHVKTCINNIFPNFIKPTDRTYIIGVGETVPLLLEHIDDDYESHIIGKTNEAIAFIQPPVFDARKHLTSHGMPVHMASNARAWVDSREKQGDVVCWPGMERPDLNERPIAERLNDKDVGEAGEAEDAKEETPEKKRMPVYCPHFSSGKADGVVETVFPMVMEKVMEHFFNVREAAVKRDGLQRGIASAGQHRRAEGALKAKAPKASASKI